jgi:hypothetical protein
VTRSDRITANRTIPRTRAMSGKAPRPGPMIVIHPVPLSPEACTPDDDAVIVTGRLWDRGWSGGARPAVIVLHRPGWPVPPDVLSLPLEGAPAPVVLACLSDMCQKRRFARVRSIPLGYEDEGVFYCLWRNEDGLPNRLEIHCEHTGDVAALRPYLEPCASGGGARWGSPRVVTCSWTHRRPRSRT